MVWRWEQKERLTHVHVSVDEILVHMDQKNKKEMETSKKEA